MAKKIITTEEDVKELAKKALDKLAAWSFAPVQRGMGVHGIPDRLACVPVTITKDMVGKTVGLFVAVEAKRPGRRGEKNAGAKGSQVFQLRSILKAAGIAGLVDCETDITTLLNLITLLRDHGVDANARASSRLELRLTNHG